MIRRPMPRSAPMNSPTMTPISANEIAVMLRWVLAWIDRVNIGFIKLTMLDDLKWSESVYGFGAGIFFLRYFFLRGAEQPAAAEDRSTENERSAALEQIGLITRGRIDALVSE